MFSELLSMSSHKRTTCFTLPGLKPAMAIVQLHILPKKSKYVQPSLLHCFAGLSGNIASSFLGFSRKYLFKSKTG